MITAESSKEEVGDFVVTHLKLKAENKDIIIKEDISGDVLLDLEENDYKEIGNKVIQMRKIKAYLDQNKDKFGEKHFTEVISIYSDSNEVAEFFKKSLNFEGNLGNLDGKALLELTDEEIKKLGLNLGKRKKLAKYIKYFKTLKVEPPKEPILTKESTLEELENYLKKKYKFSEEGINCLKEDLGVESGDSLLLLEESDIDNCSLTNEEKINLKNIIIEIKKGESNNEAEIVLSKSSDKDTLIKFLKMKCNISEEGIAAIIEGLEVNDGASFLLLEPKDIDEVKELKEDEKKRLKDALNKSEEKREEEIKITKESSIEEIKMFLTKKLNFSETAIKAIEDLGVEDGDSFFLLQKEDIENSEKLTPK